MLNRVQNKKKSLLAVKPRSRLSSRTKKATNLSARLRFKCLVRTVAANLEWMSDTTGMECQTNNVQLNLYIISHQRQGKQILALEDKFILRKQPNWRTDEEIEPILEKLRHFTIHQRVLDILKKEVVREFMFYGFKKGVTIIRQGRYAEGVSLLLYGTCQAEHRSFDGTDIDCEEKVDYARLYPGALLGELSIVQNIPYDFTLVALEPVEFLWLSKSTYVDLLRDTTIKRWTDIEKAIASFPYFKKWTKSDISIACRDATINVYEKEELIPRVVENVDVVQFIIDGTLIVLEKMVVWQQKIVGDEVVEYTLHPNQNVDSSSDGRIECIFMQSCRIFSGGCFNLGEKLSTKIIMAENKCKLMAIPRNLLLRFNYCNVWTTVRTMLDLLYPTLEQLFERFNMDRRWRLEKQKLVKRYTNRGRETSVGGVSSIHVVPLSLRANKMILPKSLFESFSNSYLVKEMLSRARVESLPLSLVPSLHRSSIIRQKQLDLTKK